MRNSNSWDIGEMPSQKAGISVVFNIAFEREGKKNEKVITTQGIRIWSPTQVRTPTNRRRDFVLRVSLFYKVPVIVCWIHGPYVANKIACFPHDSTRLCLWIIYQLLEYTSVQNSTSIDERISLRFQLNNGQPHCNPVQRKKEVAVATVVSIYLCRKIPKVTNLASLNFAAAVSYHFFPMIATFGKSLL